MLNNLCSLVECTHFVECKSITEETCAKFEINYASYCRTSETLFEGISIRPNHHYALHIGQLSRFLGPLISLSEFGGERLNGLLQSMPTNNLIGQMEVSMTKRFCQIQRLAQKKKISKLSMVAPIQEVNTHLDLAIYEVLLAHLKKKIATCEITGQRFLLGMCKRSTQSKSRTKPECRQRSLAMEFGGTVMANDHLGL